MIVSIIVPFYNGLKYINTMLNQLERNNKTLIKYFCDAKLEVIIVNDSPSINLFIEKREYNYDIYLLNNEKNLGIQKSRINGLYEAQGEYVILLDQDDIISDFCIIEHLRNIINNNLDISISNCIIQYDNKSKLLYKNKFYFKKCYNFNSIIEYRNLILSPGQCMIKKSTIPLEWIKYNLKNNGSDDYFLWIIYFNGKNVANIIEKNLYIHTQSSENFSNDLFKMYISSKEVVDLITEKKLISQKNIKKLKKNFDKYWTLTFASKINKLFFMLAHPIYTIKILKYHFLNYIQNYDSKLFDGD